MNVAPITDEFKSKQARGLLLETRLIYHLCFIHLYLYTSHWYPQAELDQHISERMKTDWQVWQRGCIKVTLHWTPGPSLTHLGLALGKTIEWAWIKVIKFPTKYNTFKVGVKSLRYLLNTDDHDLTSLIHKKLTYNTGINHVLQHKQLLALSPSLSYQTLNQLYIENPRVSLKS